MFSYFKRSDVLAVGDMFLFYPEQYGTATTPFFGYYSYRGYMITERPDQN